VKRHLVAILQSAEPERRPRAHAHAPIEGAAPPLLLVDGVLQLPFDDKLELKATADLAGQTAPSDQKRLKELVDYANDLVKLPTQASPGFVRQILAQLHDAWEKAPRSLPSGFLQKNVERGLLEQRAFCKRTVFGAPHLRAYLATDEGDVPVYLPESVADHLPLFSSFRVRLIAEAHPAEDGLETSPVALLGRALARVAEARQGTRGA
jgi:hypothetical protein